MERSVDGSVDGRAVFATAGLAAGLLAGLVVALPVRFVLTWGAPPVWWHFLAFGLGWLALLLPLARRAPRRAALVASGVFLLVLAGGFGAPWNSHDRFLKDLAGVRPAMTQGQVQNAMAGHIRGITPASGPGDDRVGVGVDGRTYHVAPQDGRLDIEGCDAYRHSNEGQWEADWGIVCFESERVNTVQFAHD